MAGLGRFGRELRGWLWRADVDDEIAAEIEGHVELLARELAERGLSPAAARAEALRRFGDLDRLKTTCHAIRRQQEREMRRAEYLAELRQDLRYAARQLLAAPGFTLVAVLTLAVGIGASTAIFGTLNGVVLKPFPFAEPDRVVFLAEHWQGQNGNVSPANFAGWGEQTTSFARLAAEEFSNLTLADDDAAERIPVGRVTRGFFDVFGVRAALGRTFLAGEHGPAPGQVVVLGHGLWLRRFGADRGIVGRTVRLEGRPYEVVGVMPPAFDPTLSGEELWVPLAWTAESGMDADRHYLTVVGLIQPGITREQAQHDLDNAMRRMVERFPFYNGERTARVVPLAETLVGGYRPQLLILLGAVLFVLLIACGNVANLLLARGDARSRELAIRAAVGAGRGRIVRQLLAESVLLAALAAAVGVGLAHIALRLLVATAPPGIPRLGEARIDGAVLAFALGLTLASTIVFGLVPALRAARPDVQETLKAAGPLGGRARTAMRQGLVATQVAIALTLLAGGGLLLRSALHLRSMPLGFDPAGVVTARVTLPPAGYAEPARVSAAFTAMLERLQQAPGVASAALVSRPPLLGGGSNGLVPEGQALEPANIIPALLRLATPGYLATLRIPLTRGRGFDANDVAGAPRVMLISEALARRAWPGQDPIGKRFACCDEGDAGPGSPSWKTVVGVVGDIRADGPAADPQLEFYLPLAQAPREAWTWLDRSMTLVARGAGDPAPLVTAMRDAARAVDPGAPLYTISTMHEARLATLATQRFATALLATLGTIGLLLAAVGIYSVTAYFVTRRAPEIGIRMALGATTGNVVRLLTWQSMRPMLVGLVVGVGAALAATRLLTSSLFGVTPTDPATFASVVAVLALVGVTAAVIPARRAARVEPRRALQAS